MNRSLSMNRMTFIAMTGLALIAGLVPATDASAQACFEHIRNLNYSPTNCSAQPEIDRVFRLQTITWKGHDYLFVDEGNEIKILNIDNPLNPDSGGSSFFNIPNVGDSDYDLMSFSVCDDCRYGIANYKAATVLFDLGTGATPSFADEYQELQTPTSIQGGFTFKYGIAAVPGGRQPRDEPVRQQQIRSLPVQRRRRGRQPPARVPRCRRQRHRDHQRNLGRGHEPPGFLHVRSLRSVPHLPGSHEPDLRPQLRRQRRHRQGEHGPRLRRRHRRGRRRHGGGQRRRSLHLRCRPHQRQPGEPDPAFDHDPVRCLDSANAVGLKYPVVHVSQQYTTDEPQTFDVSNPTNPVPLDQQFWDPSHAWNSLGDCIWNNHAIFSDDGARPLSLQVLELCRSSIPPPARDRWSRWPT